jgi:chromate reductase
MSKTITILGIAGSLRRQSYNRSALRAARQLVPEGATIDIFELDGIPGFNEDEEKNPPAKVRPEVMIGNAAERFDAQGNLTDEETKQHIRKPLQSLVEWANRISVDRK